MPHIDSYKLSSLGQSERKCIRLLIKIAKFLSKQLEVDLTSIPSSSI